MNRGESLQGYDVKLDDAVHDWWGSLPEKTKLELMEGYDETFDELSDEEQLQLYMENNASPEAQREMEADYKAHVRMVEGRIE